MKLRLISLALWASLSTCLALVANAATPCEQPGGIGGTGITADGGIGGTGIRTDSALALIGVITGFGSICVNNVEVQYDAATPVFLNGEAASPGALAVGQTVAVRAVGGASQARARAIEIIDAAVGPVTAVEGGNVVRVLGQRVRIDPWTILGAGLTDEGTSRVGIGDTLRVSGLRSADGTIVATRVDRAPPDSKRVTGPISVALGPGRFIVQGYVAQVQAGGELRVGGIAFAAEPQLAAQLAPDRLVRVSGRSEPGGARIVERAELLSSPLNPKPERAIGRETSNRREMDERRGRGPDSGRGSDSDRAERIDRSGSSDRLERPDRSGSDRVERPERVDRSGRH
jgi:hypothetical protein